MKRFLNVLIIVIVFMFVVRMRVDAATLSVNKTNVKPGETFTLNIENTNSNSIYSLEYDFSLIEKRSNTGNYGNVSSATGNGTVTFYAKQNGTVTFTLKDKNELDSTQSITMTIGASTTSTPQTTQPPTTTTSAITTTSNKSSNANLKTLEIKGNDGSDVVLSPTFNPEVYEYSSTVLATISKVSINATMEDSKSNMIISNNVNNELVAGENNKITITVTAESGAQKAYVINIKREALGTDASLESLLIDECKDFKFEKDKYSYTVKVNNSVDKLTLKYELSDKQANVTISGNKSLKDGSKVKILVTAPDGTKKEYILNISKTKTTTKQKVSNVTVEKNPLIIMTLSMIAFGLVGGIVYVIKK